MKPKIVMDIEVYPNYFLAAFYNPASGKYRHFELTEDTNLDKDTIQKILDSCELVTFNGWNYDIPMLSAAMSGMNNLEIRSVSDLIIEKEMKSWEIDKYVVRCLRVDMTDLIEVAPGQASLKIYGGRLHCNKLQDLPYAPNRILTREEMDAVALYCNNDLLSTAELLRSLTPQVTLRKVMSQSYGVDLRSKSDAQIAEAVIVSELEKLRSAKLPKRGVTPPQFYYETPSFIRIYHQDISDALTQPFTVEASGATKMPKELEVLKITIGSICYQMGMGGLHSTEESVSHYSDEHFTLYDYDVTSYYPSIILNCKLFPPHLGNDFLTIYKKIVDERLEAKKNKDSAKSDTLKIVINGSFGKLGSKYSKLYAPNLMVQVTVTGQLALLMLINWLELQGIPIVSANTDGIVIKCPAEKQELLPRIVALWEKQTGFVMENAKYRSLHSRDVNNYIAIKADGKVKTKGCFAGAGLQKNPQNEICNMAVINYLTSGTPLEQTIKACADISKFITVRTVKGGAALPLSTSIVDDWYEEVEGSREWVRVKLGANVIDGGPFKAKRKSRPPAVTIVNDWAYLGKAIRWYYGHDESKTVIYLSNGNKVPRSDGAVPCLDLPDRFPTDLNYQWYIDESKLMLKNIGA